MCGICLFLIVFKNKAMTRKIIYALFSIVSLTFLQAEAQKHPQLQYISLDAGLNMAGIHSTGAFDNHNKNFGIRLCLSGNYSFNDYASLGAALSFEQKGAGDPVYDFNTNLNYITLPLYFKVRTGKDPQLFFTAGIYGSRLLSASRRGERFVGGQSEKVNEKVTSEFRPFDMGLAAGGGIMVKLYDNFDFMVSAGISRGLLKIDKLPDESAKNYIIGISAGYIWYIGFR